MASIRYSATSLWELNAIEDYIAYRLDNPPAARGAVGTITRSIGMLKSFPEMGKKVEHIEELTGEGYRYLVSGRYVVFYQVIADEVMILRIMHGCRDIEAALQSWVLSTGCDTLQ